MNHTPGPWEADYDEYGDEIWYGGSGQGLWTIKGPGSCYLAGMAGEDEEPGSREQAEADARLISAAPDLLEALKYARRFMNNVEHDVALIDAAIRKATGTTS